MPGSAPASGASRARSAAQAAYVKAMREHELVFGLGPAGTGKTYLAVAAAVDLLMTGRVERIILSRPAVEAGERLGFLPGDLREKVDPYLRPIFDALNDMLPADQIAKRLGSGEIEVAPLAFMRGRTLAHAFVILDEAQNTTPVQMKMFLTRLGEGSRMVVTGDPTQVDLPPGAAPASPTRSKRCAASTASRSCASPRRTWCAIRWSRASSAPTRRATAPARGDEPRDGRRSRTIEVAVALPGWQRGLPRRRGACRDGGARCALRERGAGARCAHRSTGITLTDDAEQRRSTAPIAARTRRPTCWPFRPPTRRRRAAGAPLLLGDVVLAFETVRREAAEQEKPLADHLRHLVVHGVLHLLGYDHADAAEAAAMEAREIAILAELGVPDPYRDTM